jgi:hypothetical protein
MSPRAVKSKIISDSVTPQVFYNLSGDGNFEIRVLCVECFILRTKRV